MLTAPILAALLAPALPGGDEPANPAFIRALHLDLFGRTPTEKERAGALGAPRSELADRLVGCLEFWKAWYDDELYYFLLIDNFRPTAPAVVEIPERLAAGEISVPEAIHRILLSPNFNSRNPGADTFVTVVLEQCLGITVQDNAGLLAAGKRMYDGYPSTLFGKQGRGQAEVVRIALEQPAFFQKVVEREWTRLFGKPIPREEGKRAAERFREDPRAFAPIVREWAGSPRYAERLAKPRPKSDLQFVRSLYVDLLGRPPTDEEFRWTRNATRALSDPGPLRAVLARMLISSGKADLPKNGPGDPSAWIRDRFLRLLAREPGEKELAAFVAALGSPGASPSDIVEALVTHPEYAFY